MCDACLYVHMHVCARICASVCACAFHVPGSLQNARQWWIFELASKQVSDFQGVGPSYNPGVGPLVDHSPPNPFQTTRDNAESAAVSREAEQGAKSPDMLRGAGAL